MKDFITRRFHRGCKHTEDRLRADLRDALDEKAKQAAKLVKLRQQMDELKAANA